MVRYQNKNSLKISSIFDLIIALNICCTFLYTMIVSTVDAPRAAEWKKDAIFAETPRCYTVYF